MSTYLRKYDLITYKMWEEIHFIGVGIVFCLLGGYLFYKERNLISNVLGSFFFGNLITHVIYRGYESEIELGFTVLISVVVFLVEKRWKKNQLKNS